MENNKERHSMPPHSRTRLLPERDSHTFIVVLAQLWVRTLAGLGAVTEGVILCILLGVTPVPTGSPVVDLIRRYPLFTLAGGTFLSAISVGAWLLVHSQQWHPSGSQTTGSGDTGEHRPQAGEGSSHLLLATAMSTTSIVLFASLLAVVLLRPTWCPGAICPSPQRVPIHTPESVSDSNLEMYLIGIQTTAYVIPGDPAQYSTANLPEHIGAIRLDQQGADTPYRLVVGVHSVQQGSFGAIIERVDLTIDQVPPSPRPLNVWSPVTSTYASNPFQAKYSGQEAGMSLLATAEVNPNARFGLAPGEADSLAIRIISAEPADLVFHVQITYRVTNEEQEHILVLPTHFEVIFSDSGNWYTYHLENGHFVPSIPSA